MKRIICACGIGLLYAGIGLTVVIANGDCINCDDKGASNSLGACDSDLFECDSFTTQKVCENAHYAGDVWDVMQDFPTGCIDADCKNCDEPLANCKQRVRCTWDEEEEECDKDPESGGNWLKEKRPTNRECEKTS